MTVEETVLGLMEKPRGVEVRGRGLLVTGKGNPESLARWAFVRPLSDAWRVEDGRMDKQVVTLSEARGDWCRLLLPFSWVRVRLREEQLHWPGGRGTGFRI